MSQEPSNDPSPSGTNAPGKAVPPPPPVTRSRFAGSRPRKDLAWPLFRARCLYWGWTVTTKLLVTIVYLALISQGLRYVLPDIGLKLYKLPGLRFLQGFTATYRLDLAQVFVAVPLVSAWILWHWNLEIYLRPAVFSRRFQRWDLERMKRVIVTAGTIIIGADACLFCAAFTLARWGSAKFSISAVLATAAYVTVLGFVTFVSLYLSESVDHLKTRKEN